MVGSLSCSQGGKQAAAEYEARPVERVWTICLVWKLHYETPVKWGISMKTRRQKDQKTKCIWDTGYIQKSRGNTFWDDESEYIIDQDIVTNA